MYSSLKRVIDLAIAIVGLVALSPLMLVIAALVALTSRGPILYRGLRVGRNGQEFRILKFRTMVADAERLGPSSTADDDDRLTGIGRFLREFKLDELPQLFNVLFGDMSVVGPRPQVQWAVSLYTPTETALLSLRPGITDFASLRFRREGEILRGSLDPDRDYLEKISPEKIRLGLEYVRTYSLGVDVRIMTATVLAAVKVDPEWCLPRAESWSVPVTTVSAAENGSATAQPSS